MDHAGADNQRPIDLDDHGSGSARRYNAVFVTHSGSDERHFEWGTGQTPSGIASRASADASAWSQRLGHASLTELNKHVLQFAARPVGIVFCTVNSVRYDDASFIDNANAETRRMRSQFSSFIDANGLPRGIFASCLKQIDTGVLIDLNSTRHAEAASSLKVLHLLHTIRQVQAGEALKSAFAYDNCDDNDTDYEPKDRCPSSEHERPAYAQFGPLTSGLLHRVSLQVGASVTQRCPILVELVPEVLRLESRPNPR